MRVALAKILGRRLQFRARFERLGKRTTGRFRRFTHTTLLFKGVTLAKSCEQVTDHLWFTMCAGWKSLHDQGLLIPGTVVTFTATVGTYWKGYQGERWDDDLPPMQQDYKLARPADIRLSGLGPKEVDQFILPL